MTAVYGCHNREPLRDTAVVWDGRHPVNWTPYVKGVPVPMSKDCRYTHSDLGQKDAKCDGCKHRALPVSATCAD